MSMQTNTFVVALCGYLLIVAGVAYGLHAMGIGPDWIAAVALVLLGFGVLGALRRMNRAVP
jgi:hypothetical protein